RRDLAVKRGAFFSGNRFGVGETADMSVWMEHDGRRDNRAGQTSTTDFVRPGDVDEADAAQPVLQRASGCDAPSHNLPFRLLTVLHARRFALQVAQVVELRAADLRRSHHL